MNYGILFITVPLLMIVVFFIVVVLFKFLGAAARGPLFLNQPYPEDMSHQNVPSLEQKLTVGDTNDFPWSKRYRIDLSDLSYEACQTIEDLVSQYGWSRDIKIVVANIMVDDRASHLYDGQMLDEETYEMAMRAARNIAESMGD